MKEPRQGGIGMALRRTRRQMKGKRSAGNRTAGRTAVRRKKETLSSRERRQLIQLVLCGGIFVLLVVSKLVLPVRMEPVNQKISEAMGRNMDVQAVFSAVGRAFTGAEGLSGTAEEVYRAVFHPEESVAVGSSVQIPVTEDESALELLRDHRSGGGAAPMEQPAESMESPVEAETLAYVLYSGQTLPEGVSMEQALLGFDYCTPISGSISSPFGYRDHPTEGEERFHYGVDLAADTGTEIVCFADGTVTATGESSSYGKYCMVSHQNGYTTLYAHCNRILASSGAAVRKGDPIAEVGETGMATGPHLHFELQHEGVYLNPVYYVAAN